jgi:hypothetical protein
VELAFLPLRPSFLCLFNDLEEKERDILDNANVELSGENVEVWGKNVELPEENVEGVPLRESMT